MIRISIFFHDTIEDHVFTIWCDDKILYTSTLTKSAIDNGVITYDLWLNEQMRIYYRMADSRKDN